MMPLWQLTQRGQQQCRMLTRSKCKSTPQPHIQGLRSHQPPPKKFIIKIRTKRSTEAAVLWKRCFCVTPNRLCQAFSKTTGGIAAGFSAFIYFWLTCFQDWTKPPWHSDTDAGQQLLISHCWLNGAFVLHLVTISRRLVPRQWFNKHWLLTRALLCRPGWWVGGVAFVMVTTPTRQRAGGWCGGGGITATEESISIHRPKYGAPLVTWMKKQ